MKKLPLFLLLTGVLVLLGCSPKKPRIEGAPGYSGSDSKGYQNGELPGDKQIKNPEVAYNLAVEFFANRNMEAAHHYISLASSLKPDSKYSYINGIFYLQEGKYSEALVHLERAMQLGPGTTQNRLDVLNAEGACYMQLGQNDKALELFREVVNTPGIMARYKPYYNMGIIYIRKKKFLDAQAVFMKVVEENPNYFRAYSKLGLIAGINKKWGDAALYYKKALDIMTSNYEARQSSGAEVYYGYGEALFNMQKYPEARKALMEVLKIAPESGYGQEAKKMLARLGGVGAGGDED